MKMRSVFQTEKTKDHVKSLAFMDPDGGVDIQRYDTMKYRQFDKLTDKQTTCTECRTQSLERCEARRTGS